MFGGALEPLIGEGAARNEKGSAVTKWITHTHRHSHRHRHTHTHRALRRLTDQYLEVEPNWPHLKFKGRGQRPTCEVWITQDGRSNLAEGLGWMGFCFRNLCLSRPISYKPSFSEEPLRANIPPLESTPHSHVGPTETPDGGANFRCGEPVTRLA